MTLRKIRCFMSENCQEAVNKPVQTLKKIQRKQDRRLVDQTVRRDIKINNHPTL